jgi:hypothetical protein
MVCWQIPKVGHLDLADVLGLAQLCYASAEAYEEGPVVFADWHGLSP